MPGANGDGREAMKQFRCGDVVLGCEWVTRREDEQELLEEIQSHAREAHGMDEVPPEVEDQIHKVITEV
jgi:predicted small metal-binding protein